MTTQIETISCNRFDQFSAQVEFCTDNTLNLLLNIRTLLNVFLRIFVDHFDVMTRRFDIVNASYCSRSTRMLSIRNQVP